MNKREQQIYLHGIYRGGVFTLGVPNNKLAEKIIVFKKDTDNEKSLIEDDELLRFDDLFFVSK